MTHFIDYIAQLARTLSQQKQRGLVRLVGSVSQCYECIEPLINGSAEGVERFDVIPFLEPQRVKNKSVLQKNEWRIKKFRKYLGQECDILIYDAYQGINADAVAALSGVIRQGGLFILMTPADADWLAYQDPEQSRFISEKVCADQIENNFIAHLLSVFSKNTNKGIYVFNANESAPVISRNLSTLNLTTEKEPSLYITTDQEDAALAIHKLLEAQQLPPVETDKASLQHCLLVTADRGRGKSSVIGIAIAQWLNSQPVDTPLNILVTSSSLDATGILTEHFNRSLNTKRVYIKFYSPDHIITQAEDVKNKTDLVIIDEAASLPVSVVQEILKLTPKAILATTIHGYEGTGRGFEYKLKPWLKNNSESYQHVTLSEPIRWADHDDLERIVNQGICFINEASLEAEKNKTVNLNSGQELKTICEFKKLSAKGLVESGKAADVFGLLTEAHYQTSPNDLRAMLDNPSMDIFALFHGANLVATALVSREGGFEHEQDSVLMRDIQKGVRRPRGHLFPQSLLAHCGYSNAGYFNYARVVRIAVTPLLQSMGLGTELLKKLQSHYQNEANVDFLCTSYGFDKQVLTFWRNSGFHPVRLGLKADASTGLVSILMAKALSSDAEASLELWRKRCLQTINAELKAGQRKSHEDTVLALIKSVHNSLVAGYSIWSKKQNWLDLHHLGTYFRSPDSCVLAVQSILADVPNNHFELLNDKFINGLNNKTLIANYLYSGEKELVKNIRNQTVSLLNTYVDKLNN